jgi:hypothetical protein
MFQALLPHPQEVLHKWHLYCVRVTRMSVCCYQDWSGTGWALGILCACYVSWLLPGLEWNCNPGSSQLTKHARNIPSAVCVAPPEDEQVMLETYRGP